MRNRELVFAVQIIVEEIGNLLQGNLISAGVISKIISKILLLMDDDPVSIEMKQLCKIEFQNVENIMKEIEFEKNKNGALQRCLMHLELSFGIMKDYYLSELDRKKNVRSESVV